MLVLVLASSVELAPVLSLLLAVLVVLSSVDASLELDASPLPDGASPHPSAHAIAINPDAARSRATWKRVYQEMRWATGARQPCGSVTGGPGSQPHCQLSRNA